MHYACMGFLSGLRRTCDVQCALDLAPRHSRSLSSRARVVRLQKSLHLRRQRALKPQRLARDGMTETKQASMQGQPPVGPAGVLRQFRLIAWIAQHRMPGFGKVDANLVAAAGF